MTEKLQYHWLSRGALCITLGIVTLLIALEAWTIYHLGSFSFISPLVQDLLPSLVHSIEASDTLLYNGLVINGVLCAMLIGTSPYQRAHKHLVHSLAAIAFLWNGVLLWSLSGLTLVSHSTTVLKLAYIFQVYPTAEALNTFLIHISFILTWVLMIFPLRESSQCGQFHFHPDLFCFFSLAHGLYGAYLVLSLFNLEALGPFTNQYSRMETLVWTQEYVFMSSLLILVFGAFYLLTTLKLTSDVLDTLAYSHWFAFFVGLALVYVANPNSDFHQEMPTMADLSIKTGLGLLWIVHCYYSYVGSQELSKAIKLNMAGRSFLYLTCAMLSIGLLNFANGIAPQVFNHETPFWSMITQEYLLCTLLLFSLLLLNELSKLVSRPTLSDSKTKTSGFSIPPQLTSGTLYMLIIVGFFVSALAAGISLYYQEKLEIATLQQGTSIDYHEIRAPLTALLGGFLTGIGLLFSGAVFMFVKCCIHALAPHKNTAPIALKPSHLSTRPDSSIESLALSPKTSKSKHSHE